MNSASVLRYENTIAKRHSEMKQRIEPGILQTFQRFVFVLWGLLTLGVCGMVGDVPSIPDYMGIFSWLLGSTLLVYLRLRWLRRTLGRFYLPLALVAVSTLPLVAHALATLLNLGHGLEPEIALVDFASLYLWLILPLLLISLQYPMRVLWLFVIGTSILAVWVMIPVTAAGGPPLHLTTDQVFVRALLFGIVGYIITHISEAQRAQRRALAQKNEELTHYAATLEQLTISQERNRMARELHDTLAHTLSAVNIQLKALDVLWEADPTAAKTTLHATQQLTRDGLHEARRALHALRANPLEELGLSPAIRRLAETAAERAGIALRLDLPLQINSLNPATEQHLYRIAGEAISNVVRHAEAHTMRVVLSQQRDQTVLEVQDDGVGFEVAEARTNGHYGLTGMQERASLCDGTLKITSAPHGGTQIRLTIGAGV